MQKEHTLFAGPIPENYEQYLGPLFFEPYAEDIVQRINVNEAKRVLEIACGTGRVTQQLIQKLSPGAILVATDLNVKMIAIAHNIYSIQTFNSEKLMHNNFLLRITVAILLYANSGLCSFPIIGKPLTRLTVC